MATPRRSRRVGACPIVGPSGELPPADIPTNRNVLAKILLLKEFEKSDKDAKTAVLTDIQNMYRKINSNLPVI